MIEEKKRYIRRIKNLDVDSEIGSETLITLQEQGSRLLNAEESPRQALIADEDAVQGLRGLKRANRLVRINNSFVTTGTAIEEEADHLENKQAIRERRDVGRAAKWQGWKDNRVHKFASVPLRCGATAQDVLDRARFQFEEDSEDEALEDIIQNNLDELLEALQILKEAALASDAEFSWPQGIIARK
ncbi:hypothetical protein BDU57DRAFT_515685 [Ampelomyces quisqualis]|uniref:Uncharacterized protein n=1 Tax=Ampelomyces quisqualis TaxID=50730 RepID=A0A6A5QKI5_AMPQU|nr:hypothetical protein BDU57DRAFT_515685 [Ampelomyces quisqualis]